MKTYKYTVEEFIHDDGTKTIDYSDEHEQLHRINSPAHQKFHKNGNLITRCYYERNNIHREDGPAYEIFTNNGILLSESYYKYNKTHRLDGPAHIEYYLNGKPNIKQYRKNDKLHRLDGPAHEFFDEKGVLIRQEYWIEGVFYSKKQFEKKTSKVSCNNKVVEIDGKKYKLILTE